MAALARLLILLLAAYLMPVAAGATGTDLSQQTVTPSQDTSASPGQPETASVGVYLLSVYDLNHGADSYFLDFYIWFKWKGTIDPTKSVEFVNMVDKSSATIDGRDDEPDKLADGSNYKVLRVEGRFLEPSTFADYPFDQQKLTIRFEDTVYGSDRLTFVSDKSDSKVDPDLTINGWRIVDLVPSVTSKSYDTDFGNEADAQSYSKATFTLMIERPPSVFYWKLMLPLSFILVAGLCALVLPPQDIDSRLALVGGALLTVVFLQKTYSDMLPDIDYLVLMDKIYVFAYTVIVLALARVVYSYNRMRNSEEIEATVVSRDRVAFAVLVASFTFACLLLIVTRKSGMGFH